MTPGPPTAARPTTPEPPAPAGHPTAWAEWVDQQCADIASAGQWRAPRDFDAAGPEGLLTTEPGAAGLPVVSFASNDYLGLSQHPAAKAAAHTTIDH